MGNTFIVFIQFFLTDHYKNTISLQILSPEVLTPLIIITFRYCICIHAFQGKQKIFSYILENKLCSRFIDKKKKRSIEFGICMTVTTGCILRRKLIATHYKLSRTKNKNWSVILNINEYYLAFFFPTWILFYKKFFNNFIKTPTNINYVMQHQ